MADEQATTVGGSVVPGGVEPKALAASASACGPVDSSSVGGKGKGMNEDWVNAAYRSQYDRLVEEMRDDMRQQFQVLLFAGAAASATMGFAVQSFLRADLSSAKDPLVCIGLLLPLFISAAASIVIFNRARTRNRKAAFLICFVEWPFVERLQQSVNHKQVPRTVKDITDHQINLPWEIALHVLDRKTPHLPAFLMVVFLFWLILELFCAALIVSVLAKMGWSTGGAMAIGGVAALLGIAWLYSLLYRLRQLVRLGLWGNHLKTRSLDTIQGYTARWLIRSGMRVEFLDDFLSEVYDKEWRQKLKA